MPTIPARSCLGFDVSFIPPLPDQSLFLKCHLPNRALFVCWRSVGQCTVDDLTRDQFIGAAIVSLETLSKAQFLPVQRQFQSGVSPARDGPLVGDRDGAEGHMISSKVAD